MRSSDTHLSHIEHKIKSLYLDKEPHLLYDPISYILEIGGKRIRPVLAMLSCDLFEGDLDEAVDIAIATEVFHNFTLLHDDIMDKASVRRSRATVNAKWNNNIAILSGDTMLILAYSIMEKSPYISKILPIFNKMSIGVCEGQQYDMNFESMENISRDDYINMVRLKTAVLIAGALEMGAVVAGALEEDRKKIYEFGEKIGIAFQIQDDILDTYGDEKTFGKRVGGDILEGKKTFLVVRFEELASEEDKKLLKKYFDDKNTDEATKINTVRHLYNKYSIEEECNKEIDIYFEEAMHILKTIQVGDFRKEELRKTVSKLIKRDK